MNVRMTGKVTYERERCGDRWRPKEQAEAEAARELYYREVRLSSACRLPSVGCRMVEALAAAATTTMSGQRQRNRVCQQTYVSARWPIRHALLLRRRPGVRPTGVIPQQRHRPTHCAPPALCTTRSARHARTHCAPHAQTRCAPWGPGSRQRTAPCTGRRDLWRCAAQGMAHAARGRTVARCTVQDGAVYGTARHTESPRGGSIRQALQS